MYYNKKIEDIERELQTSNKGLSIEEAIIRQQKYGKNTLPKKEQDSVLKIFFSEFKDPMVILLFVTIVASLIAGEVVDAIAILFIVLIDAVMGTYQENKANNTAEALAKLVTTKTKVVRGDDNKAVISFNYQIDTIPYSNYKKFSYSSIINNFTKQDLIDRYYNIVNDLKIRPVR